MTHLFYNTPINFRMTSPKFLCQHIDSLSYYLNKLRKAVKNKLAVFNVFSKYIEIYTLEFH